MYHILNTRSIEVASFTSLPDARLWLVGQAGRSAKLGYRVEITSNYAKGNLGTLIASKPGSKTLCWAIFSTTS